MKNTVAIVSGASQGIGRETAIRLASDFGRLVLVARSEEKLKETAQRVEAAGASSLVIVADLGEPSAAAEVVERTIGEFGRIDAVVNIAGAVPQVDLLEMTDAQPPGTRRCSRRLPMRPWER